MLLALLPWVLGGLGLLGFATGTFDHVPLVGPILADTRDYIVGAWNQFARTVLFITRMAVVFTTLAMVCLGLSDPGMPTRWLGYLFGWIALGFMIAGALTFKGIRDVAGHAPDPVAGPVREVTNFGTSAFAIPGSLLLLYMAILYFAGISDLEIDAGGIFFVISAMLAANILVNTMSARASGRSLRNWINFVGVLCLIFVLFGRMGRAVVHRGGKAYDQAVDTVEHGWTPNLQTSQASMLSNPAAAQKNAPVPAVVTVQRQVVIAGPDTVSATQTGFTVEAQYQPTPVGPDAKYLLVAGVHVDVRNWNGHCELLPGNDARPEFAQNDSVEIRPYGWYHADGVGDIGAYEKVQGRVGTMQVPDSAHEWKFGGAAVAGGFYAWTQTDYSDLTLIRGPGTVMETGGRPLCVVVNTMRDGDNRGDLRFSVYWHPANWAGQ